MAQATLVILMIQRDNIMLYYYVKIYIFKSHKFFIEIFFENLQGVC
jgi:hypothetical protein